MKGRELDVQSRTGKLLCARKHGAYDFEHEYEQPFVVSIWVELNHNQFDDDLSKTINYADLQNIVHDVVVNSTPIGYGNNDVNDAR